MGNEARGLLDRDPRGEQRAHAHWITGGCSKLSERVDRFEQIILDTMVRLEQSESKCHQLALKQAEFEDHVEGQQWVWKTNDKCDFVRSVHCVLRNLWSGQTPCGQQNAVGVWSGTFQDATLWDVAADEGVYMMRASVASGERLGSSLLCPQVSCCS